MYGESNMETYITICNIDSRRTGRQVGARESCGRCVILPDSCRCLTQYYKAITLQLKIFFF